MSAVALRRVEQGIESAKNRLRYAETQSDRARVRVSVVRDELQTLRGTRDALLDDRVPVAHVRLLREGPLWYWQVDRCPFCAKRHRHGGMDATTDPMACLGTHVSHCLAGADYLLVPDSPEAAA